MDLMTIKINGVDIPIEEKCNECHGTGGYWRNHSPHDQEWISCIECNSIGTKYIYYTPKEFEQITGITYPKRSYLWVYEWHTGFIPKYINPEEDMCRGYIILPFQPAPPINYRKIK